MTHFSKKVYSAVLKIPLGEVRSYRWLARKIGHPRAYRAVGQVLKNNPYPLIIPCHRVVNTGNGLGGYSRGIRAKKMLLDLEKYLRRCIESKK